MPFNELNQTSRGRGYYKKEKRKQRKIIINYCSIVSARIRNYYKKQFCEQEFLSGFCELFLTLWAQAPQQHR